ELDVSGDRFDRERCDDICDRVCLCLLCAAAEGKTAGPGDKGNVRVYAGETGGVMPGGVHAYGKVVLKLPYRPVCGGADPGDNVFYRNDGDQYAVYTAGGRADRVYGADPDLRRVYRLCDRSVSYING